MIGPEWISLNDYSSKYKISVSTLRRRIKEDAAEYNLENGKYWLRDIPLMMHQFHARIISSAPPSAHRDPVGLDPKPEIKGRPLIQELPLNQGVESDQLAHTVHTLLQEIKKAYAVILQEKEEQIILLKEEVTDLKTLVRVLEESNATLSLKAEKSKKTERPEAIIDWAFSLDNK